MLASPHRHASACDPWLFATLWSAALLVALGTVPLWTPAGPWLWNGIAIALNAIVIVLVLWILYGTHYTLSGDRLTIRSGPFRWRLDLAAIEEIAPPQTPQSNPALSLNRLAIRYQHAGRRREIAISPRDRDAFLSDLLARVPGRQREGDRLWRQPPSL